MHLVKRSNGTLPTISSMLDTFFNDDFFNKGLTVWNGSMPAVNITEGKDDYLLELAIPGLTKKDINLEVKDDQLIISAEVKKEDEVKEDNRFLRREFRYGSFKRVFDLPDTVEANAIKASFKNGVLAIDLPKKEEAKPQPPRSIKVS